jgi:hypothetical protein
MRRWINTKVVIDIRTGKELVKEGYWYDGPMILFTNPPTRTAGTWQFANDGTESGSTLIDSPNTNQTLDVDTIYHFRIGFWNNDSDTWKNAIVQLQYNYESGGFLPVNATSSVVRSAPTSGLVDGADSTQRITAFSFDGTNEGQDEVDGVAGGPNADFINNGGEAVFAFTIRSADVSDAETIVLKITDADAVEDLDVYEQTDPTITVNKEAVSGRIMSSLASGGGLASDGGIAGKGGGLAG